jgi:ADP-ribose pyrophosphatase YjhB (NUDIX family)
VLVQRDGALLLVQQDRTSDASPKAWGLPSGTCKCGEPPWVTATLETGRKTGLQVEAGRLVDVYFFDSDPQGCGLLLVYEAEIAGGVLETIGTETVAAAFFEAEQLPTPLCSSGHDQAIQMWQAATQNRWRPGSPMRFCPHCTHPLETRLAFDRERSVCPSCGFVHFRAPKVGVSVLAEMGERVLLVRRAIEPGQGKWSLPSGFVEWDESPELAVIRECAEETGLIISGVALEEVRHYTDDFRGPGINLTYRGQAAGGLLRPGDDAAEVQLFAPDELPPAAAIAFDGHRLVLERWRSRKFGR